MHNFKKKQKEKCIKINKIIDMFTQTHLLINYNT